MDILPLIYEIQKDEEIIKIFNPIFVKKYKSRCKIVYQNKIFPLQSEFMVKQNNITKLKIKLIHFNNHLNIDSITEGCKSFIRNKKNKNYLKKILKLPFLINFSLHIK